MARGTNRVCQHGSIFCRICYGFSVQQSAKGDKASRKNKKGKVLKEA